MIIAYVGRPGGGKSLSAMERICSALRAGRIVCTDICGLDKPRCRAVICELTGLSPEQLDLQLFFLSKEDVVRFWESKQVTINAGTEFEAVEDVPICPLGCLIVLDEVHKAFSCYDNRTAKNRAMADWASTHRHDGYDVILITQDIMKVESHLRSLIEMTYYFRRVNFLGGLVQKSYLKYTYDGFEHQGQPLCNPSRHKYDSQYYNTYESYNNAIVKEVGVMKNPNILKQPVFIAIPVVLTFFLYMLFGKSTFAKGDPFGVKNFEKNHGQVHNAPGRGPSMVGGPSVPPGPIKPVPVVAPPLPSEGPVPSLASVAPPVYVNHSGAVSTIHPNSVGGFTPGGLSAPSSVTVKGAVFYDGVYHVLLSDGNTAECKKKPVIGSRWG